MWCWANISFGKNSLRSTLVWKGQHTLIFSMLIRLIIITFWRHRHFIWAFSCGWLRKTYDFPPIFLLFHHLLSIPIEEQVLSFGELFLGKFARHLPTVCRVFTFVRNMMSAAGGNFSGNFDWFLVSIMLLKALKSRRLLYLSLKRLGWRKWRKVFSFGYA